MKAAGKGIAAIPGAVVDSTSKSMEEHGVAAATTQLGLNVATLGMAATKARAISGAGRTAEASKKAAAEAGKKTALQGTKAEAAKSAAPPRPPQAFMDSVSNLQSKLRANASTTGGTAQQFLDALGGKGQARKLLGQLRAQELGGLSASERAVVEESQQAISGALTVLRDSEGPGSIPSRQWESLRAAALHGRP